MLGRTPRAGGEVDDRVGAGPAHQGLDPGRVADIQLHQPAARAPQGPGQVGLLDGPGIERVEVVDHDHLGTVAQQPVDQVRPDEPGPAGHDCSHRPVVSKRSSSLRSVGRRSVSRVDASRPAKQPAG
jgi:hypothetical protein